VERQPNSNVPQGWRNLILATSAALAFQIAWEFPNLVALILLFPLCLITLSKTATLRASFRFGFLTGMLMFGPQLAWFWNIFGAVSICLWAVLSFYTGLFVLLLRLWRDRFGTKYLWIAAPVLWTGLEYFRSELYFLRFSWISPGYAFSGHSGSLPIGMLGVYGTGFALFLVAGFIASFKARLRWISAAIGSAVLLALTSLSLPRVFNSNVQFLHVAGIQLEFPSELELPAHLDRLIAKFPDAQLIVLSEYTFDGPIHLRVRQWCRKHQRYLIAGGKDNLPNGDYYNTAFVIDPSGEIVFKQAKSVPIQFFKDGLPAPERKVWDSPWGKLAMCVCYDMSYRRVMDDFMDQGAQALIVPFMDVADWGERQHRLHERITPIRAQEYRIPIFRVGSSGISQLIDSSGRSQARGSFPGQEEMIDGIMEIGSRARLPFDRWLAPICVVLTAIWIAWCCVRGVTELARKKPVAKQSFASSSVGTASL
jgi:apolipoprotein N-acyltransferase